MGNGTDATLYIFAHAIAPKDHITSKVVVVPNEKDWDLWNNLDLLKKSKNVLDANFIEGMACTGGCIGGAGCLTHGEKNKAQVDVYGKEALEKTISDAVSILK